jgi:hypothetical protein
MWSQATNLCEMHLTCWVLVAVLGCAAEVQ